MKTIINIAIAELKIMFYSPIAWFLALVFLIQCSLFYVNTVDNYVVEQALGGNHARYIAQLTKYILGEDGLFMMIKTKGYLYIPLITMGLVSREVSSGTIRLLLSSPVKINQIILGKFMAVALFILLLMGIAGIFIYSGFQQIQSAEKGVTLSGVLALYLLFCTYAAIGLFMSCLTSYQVVAAISTLVVLALLNYIGLVWQDVDLVRNLTYFLSIADRTDQLAQGLLNTKDIFYFLIIIITFIAFSISKLQSDRQSQSALRVVVNYVTILAIALFAGYLTSSQRFILYLDTTSNKAMTLSPNSQTILKTMDKGPLEVTSYINLLDHNYYAGRPQERNNDLARWEPYLRFKKDIKFKYVYYYDTVSADQRILENNRGKTLDQIAEQYAKSFHADISNYKTPAQIRKIIDLRGEQNRYVMQLAYQGKTTFLRLFEDPMIFPSEAETDAAFKRLTDTIPTVAFLTGEYERSIEEQTDKSYKTLTSEIIFRQSLVNQGFDVVKLAPGSNEIPAGLAALVVADPKSDFSPGVLKKLGKYINDGGNLLIAGEPGKQSVINPLLNNLGVKLMDGTAVQISDKHSADIVMPFLTENSLNISKIVSYQYADSIPVSMAGVSGLAYQENGPFKVQKILTTDVLNTWVRKTKVIADSAKLTFSAAAGDQAGSVPLLLALSRQINGRQQRIIISGDADFLSNAESKRYGTANFQLATAFFGWFTYGKFPVDTRLPRGKDNSLNLTDSSFSKLKILYVWLLPGLLILSAGIFLLRRRSK